MKQKRIFLFIIILAMAALSCRAATPTPVAQTETPAEPSTPNADFSAVDAHINAYVDEKNLDGASLIVTDSGGKVIYQKNYGADFDENTVVPIASATKWLTGATVTVDSFSGETFAGDVVYISDEAEFTPRNIQTAESRSTTVYAVEIRLSNPDHKLKPGMPADAEIAISE